ncbi:MAG: hypothetical protein N4A49_03665 [Marinifilaceae bacterium]|jgi:hypothetical protein|nr:hypothetical protein [Marinifilaceae bacterium]
MKKLCFISILILLSLFSNCQEKSEGEKFIAYCGSIDNPVGVKLGITKLAYDIGFYISFNLGSTKFSHSFDYNISETDKFADKSIKYMLDNNDFEKISHKISIGIQKEIKNNFGVYLGGGYGIYERRYEFYHYPDGKDQAVKKLWIEDDKYKAKGLALEYGAMYYYKNYIFMLGHTIIDIERHSIELGIGYKF